MIPKHNAWFPYTLSENELTVYSDGRILHSDNDFNVSVLSDVSYLVANRAANSGHYIFFVSQIPFENVGDDVLYTSQKVQIYYHIEMIGKPLSFSKMVLESPELDYFYSTNHGIEPKTTEVEGEMLFSVTSVPHVRNSKSFSFVIDGETVKCTLGVSVTRHTKSKTPISLKAYLRCEFEPTNDVGMILRIYNIVRSFLNFICYRKNTCITKVSLHGVCGEMEESPLFATREKGKILKVGYLSIPAKYDAEEQKIIERTIEYVWFGERVSDVLQLISDKKLYTEHIPVSYDDGKRINVAKFVLTTAAFEWNANSFLDIPKSSSREQIKQDVLESINELVKNNGYDRKQEKEAKF